VVIPRRKLAYVPGPNRKRGRTTRTQSSIIYKKNGKTILSRGDDWCPLEEGGWAHNQASERKGDGSNMETKNAVLSGTRDIRQPKKRRDGKPGGKGGRPYQSGGQRGSPPGMKRRNGTGKGGTEDCEKLSKNVVYP